MPIKDAEDQLIKIFHRKGTELVKDASDFYPIIGMGIAPIAGGHEKTIILFTRARKASPAASSFQWSVVLSDFAVHERCVSGARS